MKFRNFNASRLRKCSIIYLLLLNLLLPSVSHALSFYFLYPEGEGDTASAQGVLDDFYAYLKSKTGLEITGLYLNDADEALDALKSGNVSIAIVAPDFFAIHQNKSGLSTELKTVPIYAGGAHEKFYLFCGPNMIPAHYAAKKTPVIVYASRTYTDDFVESLLDEDPELRNVTFRTQKTPDILGSIKSVANGENTGFILLTGYENSIIEKFKKNDVTFAKLKSVLVSKDRPSAPLVNVKEAVNKTDLDKIKQALLGMNKDAEGKRILESLRLAGFEP